MFAVKFYRYKTFFNCCNIFRVAPYVRLETAREVALKLFISLRHQRFTVNTLNVGEMLIIVSAG